MVDRLAAVMMALISLVSLIIHVYSERYMVGDAGYVRFFALLGGLAAFGAMGLLIGPLAVALFLALLRMYQRDYGKPSDPGPVSSRAEATVATAPAPDSETGQQMDASSR